MTDRPLRVFVAAGEASGDFLAASLVRALRSETGGAVTFAGLGGPAMAAEGIKSVFPVADIAVMGIYHVLARAPLIWRRLNEAVDAVVTFAPDVLVVVDSPEFTQRLARRVRRRAPSIAIVKYVAPQIWAWRAGRGRAMRPYIDQVLALLPFEPEFYARVGGPPATYVGHPLFERLSELRPTAGDAAARSAHPTIVVLPGSRASEVTRLLDTFREAVADLTASHGPFEVVMPTVPHLEADLRARVATWPVPPHIVVGEAERFAAFRRARLALAASGTVTLELALAGVPAVVAYKVDAVTEAIARRLIKVPSIVLANLVLGEHIYPAFVQKAANAPALAAALRAIAPDGAERSTQLAALDRLYALAAADNSSPSRAAAKAVLAAYAARVQRRAVIGT